MPLPTEFDLIAKYFRPLAAGCPGALSLLDDAATLPVAPGSDVVATTDAMVEGVHFLATDAASDIGWKLLAVNLSDLAAMGATPLVHLLTLALPRAWEAEAAERWLCEFAVGLAEAQENHGVVLAGGDTVATPGPLLVSVAMIGHVASGRALRRAGARPGDGVYVSGWIGDAVLALAARQGALGVDDAIPLELTRRLTRPSPRLALGRRLVGLANACADVSDGLIADLGHVCEASGVTATVDLPKVPLSSRATHLLRSLSTPREWLVRMITGGDDYELLFTVDAERAPNVAALANVLSLPLTQIGTIRAAGDSASVGRVTVLDAEGRPLAIDRAGFRHF